MPALFPLEINVCQIIVWISTFFSGRLYCCCSKTWVYFKAYFSLMSSMSLEFFNEAGDNSLINFDRCVPLCLFST